MCCYVYVVTCNISTPPAAAGGKVYFCIFTCPVATCWCSSVFIPPFQHARAPSPIHAGSVHDTRARPARAMRAPSPPTRKAPDSGCATHTHDASSEYDSSYSDSWTDRAGLQACVSRSYQEKRKDHRATAPPPRARAAPPPPTTPRPSKT